MSLYKKTANKNGKGLISKYFFYIDIQRHTDKTNLDMKQEYNVYWFRIGARSVLDELVRIAEKNPDAILTYYRQSQMDDSEAFDKNFEFGIMVPKSKLDEYRELEEMDWNDTDSYEFEAEPYMYARTRIILSDLRRLVAVSDELEDMRKKYVGNSINPAEVDRLAKDEVAEGKCAITNGPHWFSGIDEFHTDGDNDFGWSALDGFAIIIDGKTYLAVEDADDGYRSYAYLRPLGEDEHVEVINQFEPQLVYADSFREVDGSEYIDREVLVLKNKFNQMVLEISTDHSDNYYPVGCVRYYPENLPCNAKPLPN